MPVLSEADKQNYYCEKCGRVMRGDNFYVTNNTIKYPHGKLTQCKKCITMHVDNWNPETFLWILQECDVPYIPEVWDRLLAKYAKNPSSVTGVSILGRYLSSMRMNQYKEYRWEDTDFIQQMKEHKIKEAMKKDGKKASEIQEAIEKSKISSTFNLNNPPPKPEEIINSNPVDDYFAKQYDLPSLDLTVDLTEEDKKMLLLKWGKAYKPEEWIKMEQLYNEMMESYEIETAGHIDTLKLICKTSLKANQLLDIGD